MLDVCYGQSYHPGRPPAPLAGLVPVGTLMDWPVRTRQEQEDLNVGASTFSYGTVIDILKPTAEFPFLPPVAVTNDVFAWAFFDNTAGGQLYPDGNVLRNPNYYIIGQTWTKGEKGTFTATQLPWVAPPNALLGGHPDGSTL